jgi:nicotinamidase-related amidase
MQQPTETRSPFALLIIDMQNDFVVPGAPAEIKGAFATTGAIRRALLSFRERSWPVFHIHREHRADGTDAEKFRTSLFREGKGITVKGTPGCAPAPGLEPIKGEYRIVKKRFSGFFRTDLDLILNRLGRPRLVICGTQYPNCIRATITDAISLDYDVTLLTDGSSAQTEEIARANIFDIRQMGVECVTVNEFLKL